MDYTSKPDIRPVRSKLIFLDGLRGIAALYVMVGHARWLLWEGMAGFATHPDQYSALSKAWMYFFSLFRYGHEAVLFFFVLSGFVIHLKYAINSTKPHPEKFNYFSYMYRRIKRIYPPFVFSLILTFILDFLGKKQGFTIYSGTTPYALINDNVANPDESFKTLIGNLFFLFPEHFPIFGTNRPSWSLKFEWWFYLVYPALLIINPKKIIYATIIIIALFIAALFPPYWPDPLLVNVFGMMITWWLGVLLAEIYAGKLKLSFSYLSFVSGAVILPVIFKSIHGIWSEVIMGLFFFGLISFFISRPPRSFLLKALEKIKWLGDFSYTLYIIHFPIIVFFSGWILHNNGNELSHGFGYVWLAVIFIPVIAYFVHLVTEVPFTRKALKQGHVSDLQSKTLLSTDNLK